MPGAQCPPPPPYPCAFRPGHAHPPPLPAVCPRSAGLRPSPGPASPRAPPRPALGAPRARPRPAPRPAPAPARLPAPVPGAAASRVRVAADRPRAPCVGADGGGPGRSGRPPGAGGAGRGGEDRGTEERVQGRAVGAGRPGRRETAPAGNACRDGGSQVLTVWLHHPRPPQPRAPQIRALK